MTSDQLHILDKLNESIYATNEKVVVTYRLLRETRDMMRELIYQNEQLKDKVEALEYQIEYKD